MRKFFMVLAIAAAPAQAQEIATASGGVLRALDKMSGHAVDIEMRAGEARQLGLLNIMLNECRYPADDPSGNAYASLSIAETGSEQPVFSGWMIASSPALSALEHQRYDVWVIRCTTS
jgi:hypothetical protein